MKRDRAVLRKRRIAGILVWLWLGSCGGGGDQGAGAIPPQPPSANPARGEAAEVLIENFGLRTWIGIDSPTVADKVRSNFLAGKIWWIGGEVVPDPQAWLGFYFKPATVFTDEVTIEAIQATLDQIRADPGYYAPGGAGRFPAWVVAGNLIRFEPQ